MNNILYNKQPLTVNPELACLIGLNESIIVQQVLYWMKMNQKKDMNYYDGRYWTYNTYKGWQEQFPFWSVETIKRTIRKLEKSGILISGNYNAMTLDKTKWYTIDFEVLDGLCQKTNTEDIDSLRTGQNDLMDGSSCSLPMGQYDPSNTRDYTKTTTETSYNVHGESTNRFDSHTDDRFADFEEKEILHNGNDFNVGIIRKEVIAACRNFGVEDTHEIENALCVVEYYLESFKNAFRENHPFISQKAMNGVIERFFGGSDIVECDPEIYFALIDKHFATYYEDCDYNICHFMTDGIRQNRAYEIGITA